VRVFVFGTTTLVENQGLDLNYHLCDSLRKVKEKLLVGICALLFKATDLGKTKEGIERPTTLAGGEEINQEVLDSEEV